MHKESKDYFLESLYLFSDEEIVGLIIRNIISLEEIIEIGRLSQERIDIIRSLLLRIGKNGADDPSSSSEEFSLKEGLPIVLPLPQKRSFRPLRSRSTNFDNVFYCQVYDDSSSRLVYSAVYAPSSAECNKWFKVPVFLYDESAARRVNRRALEMDGKTRLMEAKPLSLKIEIGAQVDAEISFYDEGVQVSKTVRSLTWYGELTSAVFQVKAIDPSLRSVAGDITLSTGGIPLGEYSFNTDIVATSVEKEDLELGRAKSFTKAFISYAHKDSDLAVTVKKTLQGLGYKCFFDRDSLASGDLFDEKIMKSIEESDVFVLLWSKNSAQSEYVEKEYLHALPLAYPPKPEPAKLDFRPFFIDQPHTDPPVALKDINFSEWSKQ